MKVSRFASIAFLFFLAWAVPCGAQTTVAGKISARHTTYNFGTVKEKDGEATHTFWLRNLTADTLHVVRYEVSCNCTDAKFVQKQLLPYGRMAVTLHYNPVHRSGPFLQDASIYFAGIDEPLVFQVEGSVQPSPWSEGVEMVCTLGRGLFLDCKELYLLDVKAGERRTFHVSVHNSTDRSLVLGFDESGVERKGVSVEVPEGAVVDPKETRTLTFSVVQPDTHEGMAVLPVWVNGKRVKPLRIQWFSSHIK